MVNVNIDCGCCQLIRLLSIIIIINIVIVQLKATFYMYSNWQILLTALAEKWV